HYSPPTKPLSMIGIHLFKLRTLVSYLTPTIANGQPQPNEVIPTEIELILIRLNPEVLAHSLVNIHEANRPSLWVRLVRELKATWHSPPPSCCRLYHKPGTKSSPFPLISS